MIFKLNKNILLEEAVVATQQKQDQMKISLETDPKQILAYMQAHGQNKEAVYNHLTTNKGTTDNVHDTLKHNYLQTHHNNLRAIGSLGALGGEQIEPHTIDALYHNQYLKQHLDNLNSNYHPDSPEYKQHLNILFKNALYADFQNDQDPKGFKTVPWANYKL